MSLAVLQLLILVVFLASHLLVLLSKAQEFVLSAAAPSQSQRARSQHVGHPGCSSWNGFYFPGLGLGWLPSGWLGCSDCVMAPSVTAWGVISLLSRRTVPEPAFCRWVVSQWSNTIRNVWHIPEPRDVCPFGLPASRGVLELRSPALRSSFLAGRAVQPQLPDPLCRDALPWSLQRILDLGMLEPPRSPFPGKGIVRDVCCACARSKSACFGALRPGAAKAMQDWLEALEGTKSNA